MASVTSLVSSVGTDVLYLHGSACVPYTGSGTPWDTSSTTPFEIANNDVTGERWRLIAPPRTPLQSGASPFSPWAVTQGHQTSNRTMAVALQLYADSDAHLSELKEALLTRLWAMTQAAGGLYLRVAWGGKTAIACVEAAHFQEDHRYWNDEAASHMLRGTLTLECRVGSAAAYQQVHDDAVTNGVADTTLFADVVGDWQAIGQPVIVELDGGITLPTSADKVIYIATTRAATRSSSLAASLVTSSTSGGSETTAVTQAASKIRATRMRALAYLTGGSTNLEVRGRVRANDSGGRVLYDSPWLAPGTANVLLDLGDFDPSVRFSGINLNYSLTLQPRSTNGSPTTGTLTYLWLIEYWTWAELHTPNTTGGSSVYRVCSASPGILSTGPTRGVALERSAAGVLRQELEVRGDLPVAIRGAGMFVAWVSAGAFSPTDATNLAVEYLPLFETIAGS